VRRRGDRALRVAVAGPFIAGPDSLAEAITRLAVDHGIGGRVVPGAPAEEGGTLAVLIDVPSPFRDAKGEFTAVDEQAMLEWIRQCADRQADILCLDYGRDWPVDGFAMPEQPERELLRSLRRRCLLIAAGGNDPNSISTPSAYPEVLGVGPLDGAGQLREYASWAAALAKPDIFMPDDLAGTPLADALALEPQVIRGSSFSALHAVAAAILAWATLPDLSPRNVRSLLLEASKSIPGYPQPQPRRLLLRDAVALARQRVLERTLEGGPCSLQTLAAITGIDPRSVSGPLRDLIEDGMVVKLPGGRLDRFELVPQGSARPVSR
jgi:hypothetical protein